MHLKCISDADNKILCNMLIRMIVGVVDPFQVNILLYALNDLHYEVTINCSHAIIITTPQTNPNN